MKKQYHILRGIDRHDQVVMIKYPRMEGDTTEKAYVNAQLYMAERSVAATEFFSRGKRERSVAVYNYLGFDRSMSPPFAMQVTAATQLQKVYPERLQTLVFVEPPFWLKGVLGLLSPFLSDSITERIKWASGMEERESTFSELLGADNVQQATTLMRKEGKLTSPVSLEHFLVHSPFFSVYDSHPCKIDIEKEELALDKAALGIKDPGSDDAKDSLAKQASSLWGSLSTSFNSTFTSDEEKK